MKATACILMIVQLVLAGSVFAASDDKKTTVPDVAMVKEYVKAQLEIAKGMSSKTPDWAAINAQFELTLPVVRAMDARYGTHYSDEFRDALKKCAASDNVEINRQIVGKGFQHVTVLAIQQELDVMANASPADMKAAAEKIASYFEAIRPTLARRDKGFFEGKKTLEAAADAAIGKLQKADKGDLLLASRELEDVIARTYALSFLYEMKEVEKLRDSDLKTCDVKRVEASMFYRIIQPRIEKRSPKTNEILVNTLKGSFGAMNSQAVEKDLTTGLGIKLR